MPYRLFVSEAAIHEAVRKTVQEMMDRGEIATGMEIEILRAALREAERFMAYFSGETGGHFVGPGTPDKCLAQIREALALTKTESSES